MKFRLLAVIVLTTGIFFSSLIWLLDSFFYGDRENWAEMSLRTQVSVTSEAISSEAKFLQRWVSSANEETLGKIDWTSFSPYIAVGIIQKSGNSWSVLDWATEPKSSWSKLGKENFKVKLTSMGIKNFEKTVSFFSNVDNDKKASVYSFITAGDKVWFFIHSGEVLQSIIDSQKGSWSSIGIVTGEGLTLAHSIPEYIGQKMAKSPLQADLSKGQTVSGSGTYNLGENAKVFAYFQKASDVDVYVYSTMPLSELMKGRKKLLIQLSLLALGLVLVSSGLILRFLQNSQFENDNLAPEEFLIKKKEALPVLESSPDKMIVQKEKMDAYTKMASAVGHELRMPLLAILGYGQNLLTKVSDPESKKTLEALVNEARSSRAVLDKIFNFSGEKVHDRSLMKLETPLLRALKNLEPLLKQKGVKIVKEIGETQAMYINTENLMRAFENIFLNSIESMERQAEKEIEIKVQDMGSKIEVLIRDKGEGIDQAHLKKIFEPFYTTKSSRHQLGLGLSVSHGILKEHSAEVEVNSKPGQGTTFLIRFEKVVNLAKTNLGVEKIELPKSPKPKDHTKSEIQLNIPKHNTIELESNEALEKESVESMNEYETTPSDEYESTIVPGMAGNVKEDSALIFSDSISNTAKILRKPALDVNVDRLLDLPEVNESKVEIEDKDKTVVTGAGRKEPSKIDSPKKPPETKSTSVEEFKVTIRRPERKS